MQNATNGIAQFDATDAASRTNFNTALQSVDTKFGVSTGHTHDGTAGNGPKIGTAGIADGVVTPAKLSFNPSTQWYAAASGSGNAYTVTLSNPTPSGYAEGMAVAVKINVTNTGAATLNVNGFGAKAIKKANGNDVASGNLKAGSIYTLRYDGSANFILQGEGGSGTAQPAQVLSGYTFTNDNGDQTGTMPNNGAVTISPSTAAQTIAAGYHNGSGTVAPVTGSAAPSQVLSGATFASANGIGQTGTMANRGAVVITPGTANQAISAGYHNGSGYVSGDANLVAGNIKNNVTVFGVAGTMTGFQATGNVSGVSTGYIEITGLGFTPKVVHIRRYDSGSVGYFKSLYVSDVSTSVCSLSYFNGSGGASGSEVSFGATYYVNNGGFKLPIQGSSGTVEWYAYG